MKSIYPELALCGSKNECATTDTVFFRISETSNGTISLEDLRLSYVPVKLLGSLVMKKPRSR